jgi:hypothetical protein
MAAVDQPEMNIFIALEINCLPVSMVCMQKGGGTWQKDNIP